MANYRGAVSLRSAHDASIFAVAAKRRKRRTEPDLHLIKQVEQVRISALKGPAWRFAGIPSTGITDAVQSPYFRSGNYCLGCYLAAETASRGRAQPFCEGALLP